MGIMEDMQMMQYLQQSNSGQQMPMGQQSAGGMPQQMQQIPQQIPQQRNPLETGSRMAIEAAKRSLEMSDSENQRALGRALMGMAAGIKNSKSYGQGFAGNIGALTDGLLPALNAYDSERDRIAHMNHALQLQQKQEEILARKEEREMKRMNHDLEMENRKIKIAEGYLGLERSKNEEEKKEHEQLSQPGAKIPLSHLKPSQWNLAQKEIQSNIEKGEASHAALETISHIKSILKNNPNITKNMSTIMLAAQRHDPSIVRQRLNSWFIPEKTRADSEMLAKHLSNLYTSKLKGFPARGMNMFLEKQLREGNIDINMGVPSMIELLDQDEKALKPIYENAQEVYDEYEKGYFYRPRPKKLSSYKDSEDENDENVVKKEASSIASEMTEEQKQARIKELLKMRETALE